MAFTTPTFNQILTRVQADINAGLPGADARLRRSVLNILSYMIAGVSFGLYGFLSWIALQVFPDTAEDENQKRWGRIWSVDQKSATPAAGVVIATGIDGSIVPSGSELQRSDGQLFKTGASATISSGTASLTVTSETLGSIANTAQAIPLTFISAPVGVSLSATVGVNGLSGGSDIESQQDYLASILRRIQQPPHGGAGFDYIGWALRMPGVTRAWVYNIDPAAGFVTVFFMMDNSYVDGIPQPGDVANLQAYLDTVRPVTARVTALAPTPSSLNFTIQLEPVATDTPETRAAVQAELIDMILRDGEPGGTIYLSRINAAISSAQGTYNHILTAPGADVSYPDGVIPIFGSITWLP